MNKLRKAKKISCSNNFITMYQKTYCLNVYGAFHRLRRNNEYKNEWFESEPLDYSLEKYSSIYAIVRQKHFQNASIIIFS